MRGKKNPIRDLLIWTGMIWECRMFGAHKLFRAAVGATKVCSAVRTDGRVIEVTGDDSAMRVALRAHPGAVRAVSPAHVPKRSVVLRHCGDVPSVASVISGCNDLARPI